MLKLGVHNVPHLSKIILKPYTTWPLIQGLKKSYTTWPLIQGLNIHNLLKILHCGPNEKSFASPCKDDSNSSWKCLAMPEDMPPIVECE